LRLAVPRYFEDTRTNLLQHLVYHVIGHIDVFGLQAIPGGTLVNPFLDRAVRKRGGPRVVWSLGGARLHAAAGGKHLHCLRKPWGGPGEGVGFFVHAPAFSRWLQLTVS
jgi:hypothetical protein